MSLASSITTKELKLRPTLEHLHNIAMDHATATFNKEGRLPPTFILSSGPLVCYLVTDWTSDEEKYMACYAVAGMLNRPELHVNMYSFMCEAWAALYKDDVAIEKEPRPRNRPDREEILLVDTFGRNGQFKVHQYRIIRGSQWRVSLGGPEELKEGMSGALWDLFKP